MSLEEQAFEFWWSAGLWRKNHDALAYEILMQLKDETTNGRIRNRIYEIERAEGKEHTAGPVRSA